MTRPRKFSLHLAPSKVYTPLPRRRSRKGFAGGAESFGDSRGPRTQPWWTPRLPRPMFLPRTISIAREDGAQIRAPLAEPFVSLRLTFADTYLDKLIGNTCKLQQKEGRSGDGGGVGGGGGWGWGGRTLQTVSQTAPRENQTFSLNRRAQRNRALLIRRF